MGIEEEVRLVSEKIKDSEWWIRNEERLGAVFGNDYNRAVLKRSLILDKNPSILEAARRLGIFVEERFVLGMLDACRNINQHTYYALYSLYQKRLISQECLEKVKRRFAGAKNAGALFHDAENRYIVSRMEKDRHRFKKAREEALGVHSLADEALALFRASPPLHVEDMALFGAAFSLGDVLVLFDMDALFSACHGVPAAEGAMRSLHESARRLQDSVFGPAGDDVHLTRRRYASTGFAAFKSPRSLAALDTCAGSRLSAFRTISRGLQEKEVEFYCMSHLSLGMLLASAVVFDLEFISFESLVPAKRDEVLELLTKRNSASPRSRIFSFGLGLCSADNPLADIVEEYSFEMVFHVLSGYF